MKKKQSSKSFKIQKIKLIPIMHRLIFHATNVMELDKRNMKVHILTRMTIKITKNVKDVMEVEKLIKTIILLILLVKLLTKNYKIIRI